ncbi:MULTISPECIES: putative minor capsid protein [unclassified Treponema]|uniref:putative minor capsid protein n=1 Tax=unclassified Treponema TaxID=2638727 RepID=UPI0020A5DB1C|nr:MULTISPECIES: putative minor capsid protein [unclassified Treponema]UTC66002.1 minor capsid protein [Treponema sp. OMZ 789]UTC68732.1 minor capsid protein [Treponema sp. OMZ 790]UTC71461.1 minor capsid protein [Treponema sp. OMZ 791]
MTKPIPTRLLVHDCVLKKPKGLDRNRNPIYESTILKRVRIGATFQSVRGAYGETKTDTLTLFIDAKNTRCETIDGEATERKLPAEKDAIEWQGQTFTVRSITPCYTQGSNPHHWEVTLE